MWPMIKFKLSKWEGFFLTDGRTGMFPPTDKFFPPAD